MVGTQNLKFQKERGKKIVVILLFPFKMANVSCPTVYLLYKYYMYIIYVPKLMYSMYFGVKFILNIFVLFPFTTTYKHSTVRTVHTVAIHTVLS
jgi:hypothetical protein